MCRLRLHIAVIALSIVLAACTLPRVINGPPLLNVAPAGTQPAPRAPAFPRGRFHALSAPNMLILAVENDGRFRIYLDGALLDSGQFSTSGPQASVDSMLCAARGIKPTAYSWTYDEENVLNFIPVFPDPCPERRQYLAEIYEPQYLFVLRLEEPDLAKE